MPDPAGAAGTGPGTDAFAGLRRAALRTGGESSDYDLNGGVGRADPARLRPAAVLVAAVPGPRGLDILLTKRSPQLQHHPGQVAFPGGKIDPGDADATACALREAREEIGLDPAWVSVLGRMPAHETVTGFSVTPVLAAVAPGFRPVPEAGEVDEVFRVPLAHLADPTRYRIEQRRWRGTWRRYYTIPWGPYYIWGATARILRALADGLAEPGAEGQGAEGQEAGRPGAGRQADADHGGLDRG